MSEAGAGAEAGRELSREILDEMAEALGMPGGGAGGGGSTGQTQPASQPCLQRVYRRRAVVGYAEALRHAGERGPGETAELIKAAWYDLERAVGEGAGREDLEETFYLLRRELAERASGRTGWANWPGETIQ